MGNCLFGGLGEGGDGGGVIKVITSSGGVMEFSGAITAGCITNEFPGHAIYPSHDLFWRPLSLHEDLVAGHSYYLLPLHTNTKIGGQVVRQGHVRSKSIPTVTPYRMSFDYQGMLKRSYTEAFSSSSSRYSSKNNNYNNSDYNNGFWKVKLVITPEQLVEILSQEAQTQELVENMRAVAKCGNGSSSSDQWSLSSSRNGSSKKDGPLEI